MFMAALSITALVQYGFDFGFGPTLSLVLDYYDRLISIPAGWVEPHAQRVLVWINSRVDWELQLYPHWKHVVVLMFVYFSRVAQNDFVINRPVSGVIGYMWGLIVATASGVGAGTVSPATGDIGANFIIVAIPISGYFVYWVGAVILAANTSRIQGARLHNVRLQTWWEFFSATLKNVAIETSIALVLVVGALQVRQIRNMPGPGVTLLGGLVIILAFYLLWSAKSNAALAYPKMHIHRKGEKYWLLGRSKIGAAILGLFFWLGVFLASNAGLGLWGL